MCNNGPPKSSTNNVTMRSSVAAAVPRRRQRGGERGSWYHFLTNSFHGILGMTSFSVTLSAWIYNEIANANVNDASSSSSPPSVLALVLIILSVITTTILSIHSSWYMLEQSPQQSTILDYKIKLQRNNVSKSSSNADNADNAKTFNIKVVAPHRGAFHRTSIIMQYANARILLLLQRQHYHFNQQLSSSSSLSGVMLWGLVSLMCLRMLPIPDISKLFTSTTEAKNKRRTTITDMSADKTAAAATTRKLPGFWANGNSYCFVLPMVMGVVGDFCMTAWCEYHYYYYHQDNSSRQSETSSSSNPVPSNSSSLFQYHSRYWLSLWHLLFLQVVAHTIAFGFTLAFRLKHSNKNKNKTKFDEKDKTNSSRNNNNGKSFFFQYINTTTLLNIQTLYWVCTIGVYALVVLGLVKATATLRALG